MKSINYTKYSAGFTFPELIVSLAILAVVFTMITINISPLPANTVQTSTVDRLTNDVRSQQTLAMSDKSPYGIHFENDRYTLFKGSGYVAGKVGNFVVTLDEGVIITNVTFPGQNLIFSAGSGDVTGYVQGSDGLVVESAATNKSTEIHINKYGARY